MIRSIKIAALERCFPLSKKLLLFILYLLLFCTNASCFFISKSDFMSLKKLILSLLLLFFEISLIAFTKIIKLDMGKKSLKSYLRLFVFEHILFFFKAMLFMLFFSPVLASLLLFFKMLKSSVPFYTAALFLAFCGMLLAVSTLFFTKANGLLFMCEYCFAETNKISEAIKNSVSLMKNKTGRLVRLRFSFSGWFLLCVFVLPLPFVLDYYNKSMNVFAKEIAADDR